MTFTEQANQIFNKAINDYHIKDDSEYFISQEHYDHWLARRETTPYVRYSLVRELHSPYLSFHNLMEHGLGGAPRSPRRLQPEVIDYILSHFE